MAKSQDKFTQLSVAVNFENDEIRTTFPSKDYLFKDLDAWIRSRYGISERESLRYMNKLGEELIPTQTYLLDEGRVYVKKIKGSEAKKSPTIWGMSQWQFSILFLTCTTMLMIVGLYGETTVPPTMPVKYICSLSDDALLRIGLIPKRGVTLEAFIAFVCWSSTYIFVRRLWNPENYGVVIEKFAADSFFGGLAAAASIVMKHLLLRSLS